MYVIGIAQGDGCDSEGVGDTWDEDIPVGLTGFGKGEVAFANKAREGFRFLGEPADFSALVAAG